jgi:hypothetical protein
VQTSSTSDESPYRSAGLNSSPKNEIVETKYSDLHADVNGCSHIAPEFFVVNYFFTDT